MSDDKVVIVSAKRTPIGSFQGNFESLKATELGSRVIEKNINDISINPKEIDETIMGCVLPAGLGQAPARQAAIGAGIAQVFVGHPFDTLKVLIQKEKYS